MNLAMFGGSFDPVHNDHVELCTMMLKDFNLDKVVVFPAACSPFKSGTQTSDLHRLNMCKLAFAGENRVEVSDFEILRGGKSYTIDTLNFIKDKYDVSKLYLIMGADAFMTLSSWYKAEEIFGLAHILTIVRGEEKTDSLTAKADEYKSLYNADCSIVNTPVGSISSTLVRNAIKLSEDLNDLLPENVAEYIKNNRLYGYAN